VKIPCQHRLVSSSFIRTESPKASRDDKRERLSPDGLRKELHMMREFPSDKQDVSLMLMSNHGRWEVHAQCDDISGQGKFNLQSTCLWRLQVRTDLDESEGCWLIEIFKTGDMSKSITSVVLYYAVLSYGKNDTRKCLRWSWRPNRFYHAGEGRRGGAINLISRGGTGFKNCLGQLLVGYLVEVRKVIESDIRNGEKWSRSFRRTHTAGNMIRPQVYASMPG